ncbi:RNA polymerase II elongation factor Ell isoform X3 [Diorhabda carinulata]|uniref:RNA polymerase II elongation factor Ell isoform X2 n=1 Tax=Diorhabda sublineata TaxID=1163346 RepID=UPI0024E0F6A5|nr:RNA polymerase II elongation factor Ell isoform X2 [Diorhabda sublineata]XP_057663152.1 RNA polymerase II elongation factor Ell isoform X3 [Diorhabda carinulata]
MAALCPGVQYGLSSQQNYGENRDLIFVKLTDSALRAIDDYIKNQNKFYNNKPKIQFLGENGELSFPSLHHSMGSTSFRFSMSSTADMEGQGGSFECIKQVGPPRGPLEGLGSIPYKIRIHANDDVYEVTRNRMTEAEDKYKNKCTREIKPNQTDIGRKVKVKQSRASVHPVRREMPSMRDSLLKQPSQPYQPKPSIAPPSPVSAVHSSTNGHLSNGLGSNHVSSSRPLLNAAKKLSVPEIRRPPNRKPQTLTPPGGGGSDGGSSGSGQSPTSTLPGSPPLISTTSTGNKRPGYHEGSDGFSYKRQRIAHNAPKHHPDQLYHQPVENNSQRRPVTDSRDSSNMNPRSRESPSGGGISGNSGGGNGNYGLVNGHSNNLTALDVKVKRDSSDDDDDDDDEVGKRACDSHFDVSQEKTFVDNRSVSPAVKMVEVDKWDRDKLTNERQNGTMNRITNGISPTQHYQTRPQYVPTERTAVKNHTNVTSSTENRIARVSPDSQTEGLPNGDIDANFNNENEDEFPDYKKEYVTIRDAEQRRRYKADFNADYTEYRDLHSIVEKVSRRFAQLEERLKKEEENSPKFKDVKKQIVREYQENKKNMNHQRAKRRFQYLHEKLSHIKRLVMEYDQEMTDSRY